MFINNFTLNNLFTSTNPQLTSPPCPCHSIPSHLVKPAQSLVGDLVLTFCSSQPHPLWEIKCIYLWGQPQNLILQRSNLKSSVIFWICHLAWSFHLWLCIISSPFSHCIHAADSSTDDWHMNLIWLFNHSFNWVSTVILWTFDVHQMNICHTTQIK